MGEDALETRHIGGKLPTTRWTLVDALQAGEDRKRRALEELCVVYWGPVYAFIRRKGRSPQDAEDLAQEFLVSMIESESFERISPEKGRLRSFLLQALQNFLAVDFRDRNRHKRGGKFQHVSVERDLVERGVETTAASANPEIAFEEHWARCLLERAIARLAETYAREGKTRHFEVLFPMSSGWDERGSFAEAGRELDLNEGAARVAAFRLRKRLRMLVREEVAATVAAGDDEIEAELQHLFVLFGARSGTGAFDPPSVPSEAGDDF